MTHTPEKEDKVVVKDEKVLLPEVRVIKTGGGEILSPPPCMQEED